MKTVLFVPGFPEDLTSRDYDSTIGAIKNRGYRVKFVPIKWSRTTIADWTKQLDEVYSEYKPEDTILAGFSFGAMTAFMSASKRNPYELWLFSLSPYFAEDLKSKNMKKSWLKQIGICRVNTFAEVNFESLSKLIKCKTLLFSGRLELDAWPVMGERAKLAQRLLSDSKLTVVNDVGHDVSDRRYISEIESVI